MKKYEKDATGKVQPKQNFGNGICQDENEGAVTVIVIALGTLDYGRHHQIKFAVSADVKLNVFFGLNQPFYDLFYFPKTKTRVIILF